MNTVQAGRKRGARAEVPVTQDAIVDAQLGAVDRLQAKDFDRTLLDFVGQILASPRQGAPQVAFDFWQQFGCINPRFLCTADHGFYFFIVIFPIKI